jgi:hypothetical protein
MEASAHAHTITSAKGVAADTQHLLGTITVHDQSGWPSPATSARRWRKREPWKKSAGPASETAPAAKARTACSGHSRSASASELSAPEESRKPWASISLSQATSAHPARNCQQRPPRPTASKFIAARPPTRPAGTTERQGTDPGQPSGGPSAGLALTSRGSDG